MGKGTAISWATDTFNIWWGCQHADRDDPDGLDAEPAATAPECLNCYAENFDKRVGGTHWGPGAEPRWFGDAYWSKPARWNAEALATGERRRVFCSSMADVFQFHQSPEVNRQMDVERAKLWKLISNTPALDWLILTKRIERAAVMLPWVRDGGEHYMRQDGTGRTYAEPWPNVWLGTSCGARSSLWRVERLRQVPAAVRFVSAEPLTEHITAEEWDDALACSGFTFDGDRLTGRVPSIHWLIVGDESHQDPKKRRPAQVDWIRTAREAALRHGVAFHFKQWNGPSSPAVHGMRAEDGKGKQGKIHLPVLDGKVWDQRPAVDLSS